VRIGESLLQRDPGRPAQHGARLVDREKRVLLLAWSLRGELDFRFCTRGAEQRFRQAQNRCRHTRSDIERTLVDAAHDWELCRGHRERCLRDVADVYIVASLRSVAEDAQRPPVDDPTAKNRDDSRLTVWILARTVHVPES